jgi:very-short-patch-repair endonuclease
MTSNASVPLITTNLNSHFRAARKGIALSEIPSQVATAAASMVPLAGQEGLYKNYSDIAVARGALQGHTSMRKEASGGLNISFGQPNFFSPVYTPINWQIPSKRREVYQWSRFFYENEPRVAAAIDFYSRFPVSSDFQIECDDRYVKQYFEKLCERLDLRKWFRIINHEVHLLGDCFPFLEVECEYCHGSGQYNGQVCEHEGGTFSRLVVLNPDFIEVFTNSLSSENSICLIPDDELKQMAKSSSRSKLAPNIARMAMEGQPIPLDNFCVSHLKYGESGYRRFGISMIRRLFPILAYKTKLMTAQWIVAERMIIPVKVVKVGNEDRPASPMDISSVQAQLQATANDPNLVIVTHHAFDMSWVGSSGQVLQLSTEWEFINQEILDGLGINKSLLNAEGPVYASAAIGAEVMIRRLDEWRQELARWAMSKIFAPIAKMNGFIKENEWGEKVYIVPKIRWNPLNLRDVNQERQNLMTLYDKGVISRRRLLEEFKIDSDIEAEQIRYERIESMADAPAGGEGGGGGGLEGALGGGGGGGLDLGGGGMPPDMGGGGMEGGAPGMDGGGGAPPPGGEPPVAASTSRNTVNIADYGGKILSEKSRRKMDSLRMKGRSGAGEDNGSSAQKGGDGFSRDEKGRIWRTSLEIAVQKGLEERQRVGRIPYRWTSQLEVSVGPRPYLMDFAFPAIKLDVEADGGTFHSSADQIARDNKRDSMLRNAGWTVIRFKEDEIEQNIGRVLDRIEKEIARKSQLIKSLRKEVAHIPGEKRR